MAAERGGTAGKGARRWKKGRVQQTGAASFGGRRWAPLGVAPKGAGTVGKGARRWQKGRVGPATGAGAAKRVGSGPVDRGTERWPPKGAGPAPSKAVGANEHRCQRTGLKRHGQSCKCPKGLDSRLFPSSPLFPFFPSPFLFPIPCQFPQNPTATHERGSANRAPSISTCCHGTRTYLAPSHFLPVLTLPLLPFHSPIPLPLSWWR